MNTSSAEATCGGNSPKKDIEAAIDEFELALRLDPDYAPAHAGLARAHLFSAYYGDKTLRDVRVIVEKEIDRALELQPSLAGAYATLGSLARDDQQWEESERLYRKAIELDPSDPEPYLWLANVVDDDVARFEEALALRAKAFELDPRNMYVRGVYAAILAIYGERERALEIYRQSIIMEPDSPRPYGDIALLHSSVGDFDLAVRARLAQIERAPSSPGPYGAIASYFLSLEDQDTAQAWFEKAKNLDPNAEYWPYWFIRPQDHKRLVREMEANLARRPENLFTRMNLAYAYFISGDYEGSFQINHKVLTSDDEGSTYHVKINTRSAAKQMVFLLRRNGDEEGANDLVKQINTIAMEADSGGVVQLTLVTLFADVAIMQRDWPRALEKLEEAVSRGWLATRLLEYDPFYSEYRSLPEFQELINRMRAKQRRMRNALRAEGLYSASS